MTAIVDDSPKIIPHGTGSSSRPRMWRRGRTLETMFGSGARTHPLATLMVRWVVLLAGIWAFDRLTSLNRAGASMEPVFPDLPSQLELTLGSLGLALFVLVAVVGRSAVPVPLGFALAETVVVGLLMIWPGFHGVLWMEFQEQGTAYRSVGLDSAAIFAIWLAGATVGLVASLKQRRATELTRPETNG